MSTELRAPAGVGVDVTTAYRDDERVLRDRLAELETEQEALRGRARELREVEAAEARLAAEIAETSARLEALRGPAMELERLRIASPCKADWSQMVGDDRVRFCGLCKKNVYDLSGMRRDEAVALIKDRTGELCVRLWRRADGTVLTADCPVGERGKRVRRLAVLAGGGILAGAAAAAASLATVTTGDLEPPDDVQVVAGGIGPTPSAEPPPAPPPPQVRMGAPMHMGKVAIEPPSRP